MRQSLAMTAALANKLMSAYCRRMISGGLTTRATQTGRLLFVLCSVFLAVSIFARESPPLTSADDIVREVLRRRPTGDIRLRGKLYRLEGIDGKKELGLVELFVRASDAETRTVIRVLAPQAHAGTTVLALQPTEGAPRIFLARKGEPAEELAGARLKESFIGSDFSYEDLNLAACLHWPKRELLGNEIVRGQNCYKLEFTAAPGASSQYAKAICWIERERFAVVKTETYDADGAQARKFSVAALKKVVTRKGNELWGLKAAEILWRPPRQSLPDAEKTRLEIIENEYDTQLPDKVFAVETFSQW
jgi:hypothetical protein